jgi:hypothetical protein
VLFLFNYPSLTCTGAILELSFRLFACFLQYHGVYLFVLLVSLLAVCLRAVLFLAGQLFLPDRLFLQPVLLLCTVLFPRAVLLVLQLFCLLCWPRLPFPLLFERGNVCSLHLFSYASSFWHALVNRPFSLSMFCVSYLRRRWLLPLAFFCRDFQKP